MEVVDINCVNCRSKIGNSKRQMKIRMTRTFHPVGQGAFYSEKFDFGNGSKLNIVYDCGTLPQCGFKGMQGVVDAAFGAGECIDGVFISHFDEDHVNGFPLLFKRVRQNVRHIFLPHLTTKDILMELVYNNIGEDELETRRTYADAYCRLIADGDPSGVFDRLGISRDVEGDPEVHIIYPEDAELPKDIRMGRIEAIRTGEDVFAHLVGSRDIQPPGWPFWHFIPYNYNFRGCGSAARVKFENALKRFLRARSLKEDSSGVRAILTNLKLLTDFKRHYVKNVSKDINGHSMTLLSCPSLPCCCYWMTRPENVKDFRCGSPARRAGCLYTGDYNASSRRRCDALFNAYSAHVCKVGCVQLPHHGSGRNYNYKLGALDAVFVACYGKRNAFHHPGMRVRAHLYVKRRKIAFVTEDPASKYTKTWCML